MNRLYLQVIADHFSHYDQMVFLTGPRQVGKSTVAKTYNARCAFQKYLNWDKESDRIKILNGGEAILQGLPLDVIQNETPLLTLDEIHKYRHWKIILKELIDEYKGALDILVTGSAKLDVYKKGGDSLMGRYFLYRMHPFSVAELLRTDAPQQLLSLPKAISNDIFEALFEFGGFPEPLAKQEKSFYVRWQKLRLQQMFREDIRDAARIQEIAHLELLANLLRFQVGGTTTYSELAKKVRVAETTICRWIQILESYYYCFTIKPWSANVSRSLIKEPKLYLWDWSIVPSRGAKVENFVASHLYKAVHYWTDQGKGNFELYFVRDKEKREVDFLVTQNEQPWILIEVKTSYREPLNPHLFHFQKQLKAQHVYQIVFDMPYVDADCFALSETKIVSLKTFLSQLI